MKDILHARHLCERLLYTIICESLMIHSPKQLDSPHGNFPYVYPVDAAIKADTKYYPQLY